MAGAGLIPHTLPGGQTIMVPDYLVPPALRLPDAPAPAQGPDLRTADASGALAQMSPQFQQVLDAGKAPTPGAGVLAELPVPAPPADAQVRAREQDRQRAMEAAKEAIAARANPKNLKPVPKPDPRHESSVIADNAQALYGKKPGVGAPGQPQGDPDNLILVDAEVKQERVPGTDLLPEQKWAMGLEQRPDLGMEVDPTAEQPTWGTADPVMRPRKTALERAAESYATQGKAAFDRQEMMRQEANVINKTALVQQSEALDSRLNEIASQRSRIAQLQDVANKRATEAASIEPRTRAEIWSSQGTFAQGMGILAVALGGALQATRGGENQAARMLDNWINGAVDDDRYKYERAARMGLNARNDFERAMATYGDLSIAELDVKNRKIASALALNQQMMADRALDASAQDRGNEVQRVLYAQYLENQRQQRDLIQGKVTKEEATLKPYGEVIQKATPKPVGSGGGAASAGITGDKLKNLSKEVRSLAVKMPDGRYKFVRSEQERIPMQARLNNAGAMLDNLRQLQRLRSDKSNTIPWGKKRGQIEAIGANLLALGKSKDQMGTLDKGLLEFSARRYGSPEQFNLIDNSIDGKLEENIRLLEAEVRKASEYDLDNGPFELTEGGVTPSEVHD